MPLAHPKSFVAGLLLLSRMVTSSLASMHQARTSPLSMTLLFVYPVLVALCFGHAFRGKTPMFDKSELRTSLWLGSLSLALSLAVPVTRAVLWAFAWSKFYLLPSSIALSALHFAAAVYYFRMASQERRAIIHQEAIPPFGTEGWP
jgi:hypothetical protein